MCADTYIPKYHLYFILHIIGSLSLQVSLLCPFPSLLFSLLHFLSHRGSGGPPPQSIMVKSQSTAAHSGHCADKLVREENRRKKEGEVEKLGATLGVRLRGRGRVHWVHCTVKEWARSPPGRVWNGWVSQYHWWSPREALPLTRELCLHTDVSVPLIFSPCCCSCSALLLFS